MPKAKESPVRKGWGNWGVRKRGVATEIVVDVRKGSARFAQEFLLTSDRHWDNPHSDQDLQREHLEEVKRKGAPIIDLGDLFCLMQGRYDPRRSRSAPQT